MKAGFLNGAISSIEESAESICKSRVRTYTDLALIFIVLELSAIVTRAISFCLARNRR